MSPDPPLACSLDAVERTRRLAQIRAVGRDSLLSASPQGRMRFRRDPATQERLEAIIAAESQCCPFLGFDLVRSSGELVLTITARDGAELLAQDLVDAFAAGTRERVRRAGHG